MSSAFELQSVHKSFQLGDDHTEILHGINLNIALGEYVAIMGPSGSGKSTLMNLLGCLDQPSQGSLRVMGKETGGLHDDELSRLRGESLGFVFQAFHLLPSYDAVSNVTMGMVYTGHPNRRERAVQLLTQLGLAHRLHSKPATLSGGEKQRIAIARALSNDSPVLLADEPTGALDQKNGQDILALFEQFHRNGKTIVVVTHDIHVAERASRVIQMLDGRINHDSGAK